MMNIDGWILMAELFLATRESESNKPSVSVVFIKTSLSIYDPKSFKIQ